MALIAGEAKLALKFEAELGESALWDHRQSRLWWVDILKGQVHRFDPLSGANESFDAGPICASIGLDAGGDLVLAQKDRVLRFQAGKGNGELLWEIEHAAPEIRFNEGRCDPMGRFWVGSLALGENAGRAALYCLEPDLSFSRKLKGLSISNGLAWNPKADRMYYIDSASQRILEFQYEISSGAIQAPRLVLALDPKEGSPDGMCCDSEGMLWVALWGGGKVLRLNPKDGERLAEIRTPDALQCTSCSLGGQDMKTLFITTAREHLNAQELESQAFAGSLFQYPVDCPGLEAFPFQKK